MKLFPFCRVSTEVCLANDDDGACEIVARLPHPEGQSHDAYYTAKDIARAVNACHGLDLPADVTPGIMEDLVEDARNVITSWEGGNLAEAVRGLAETLASLDRPPVSPESDQPATPATQAP